MPIASPSRAARRLASALAVLAGTWIAVEIGLLLPQPAALAAPPDAASHPPAGRAADPARIVGAETCAKCHTAEIEVWKKTHHCATWDDMHRSDEAKEIAKKMGVKRIKQDSVCITCHYTSKMEEDKPKPFSGVSCEMCHGPARDWVDAHNDYGGKDVTKDKETAEHRAQRWANAEKGGMIRPTKLYDLASNCLGCHTVPEEFRDLPGHFGGTLADAFDAGGAERLEVHVVGRNVPGIEGVDHGLHHRRRAADVEGELVGWQQALEEIDGHHFAEANSRTRCVFGPGMRKADVELDVRGILTGDALQRFAVGDFPPVTRPVEKPDFPAAAAVDD